MGLLNRLPSAAGKWLAVASLLVLGSLCTAMYVANRSSRKPSRLSVAHEAMTAAGSSDVWMLVCSILVFIMTPGVALFYGGLAKNKNHVSTIMQGLVPMALVPVLWSFIGFSLSFGADAGNKGLIGSPTSYGLMLHIGTEAEHVLDTGIPIVVLFIFQLQFAIVTPALIIGSISGRANLNALCLFVCLWHLVVYCPIAHMVWHPEGLIGSWGVPDFAGGLVVHVSSGFAALVCAWYLTPRSVLPSYLSDRTPNYISGPANVPIVLLGTSLLCFGWFGFNAGNALAPGALAAQALLNTQMAMSVSIIVYQIMDYLRGKQMQATRLCYGGLVGLVCITPASGYVDEGASMLIGLVGAVICSLAEMVMSQVESVSEDLHVFAHHGVGGTVGMICTALFATTSVNSGGIDGAFSGNPLVLAKAVLVLVLVVPWIMLATLGCLWVTDMTLSLRVTDAEAMVGLDVAKHGENATAVGAAVAEMNFGAREGLAILHSESFCKGKLVC